MKPFLPLSATDPFATLINLMGAALSGNPNASEPGRREDPRDEPAPLRPEPAETPAPRKSTRSLLDRLDAWSWRMRQRELEQSLASSLDVAELEARIRARERAAFHRYY